MVGGTPRHESLGLAQYGASTPGKPTLARLAPGRRELWDRCRYPRGHVAQVGLSWNTFSMDATLVLGQQGRVVIPADIRSALGLAPGDRLHLHVAGQRLVLERQQDAVTELRRLASAVS